MKQISNGLYSLDFTAYNAPNFIENKRGKYVEYGEDNAFPFYLVDLFNGSSVHNAIVTGKVNYIVGRGLTVPNDMNTLKRAMVEAFVFSPNPYETWNDIFKKIAADYEIYNGFAIEVLNDKNGKISEVYHMDFGRLRVPIDDRNNVMYSDEWLNLQWGMDDFTYNRNFRPKTTLLPLFNPNKTQSRSVIYHREYRPNMKEYPLPDYIGALQQIRTQIEISNFDLNTIVNGFAGGTMINLYNGMPPEEEQKNAIEQQIYDKAAGSSNGNRILINFADSKDTSGAEILNLMGNDLPDRFAQLEKRVTDSIFIGHKVTSPMLFGVKTEGQLGGRTEMLNAYELFKETYIQGRQRTLLNVVNDVFDYKGLGRPISVEELRPITTELPVIDPVTMISLFDREKLKERVSEVYGISPSDEQNTTEETQLSMKFEEQFDDAILNYFKNKGVKADDYEVVADFQVHADNESVKFEINENDFEFADPSEKQLAEIAKIVRANKGITIAEVAKVMKVDVATIESAVQALINKKMIVRADNGNMNVTQSALPLIMKLPNPDEILLVKYQYGIRNDMIGQPLVIQKTRQFCRELVASNKLYTKEEIEGMRNDMEVSFLPYITNVWMARGGWYRRKGTDVSVPFCRHIWRQVVVKSKR